MDVFNDLEKTEFDSYKLPNLVAGNEIDVVMRLKVPALLESIPLVDFRLVYDETETNSQQVSHHQLQLPVVNSTQLHNYSFNEEVKAKVAQLMASRAREEAIHNLDRGDIFGTRQRLQQAKEEMMAAGVCYDYIASDLAEVDDLLKDLETGNQRIMRKKATYQSYQKRRNRP